LFVKLESGFCLSEFADVLQSVFAPISVHSIVYLSTLYVDQVVICNELIIRKPCLYENARLESDSCRLVCVLTIFLIFTCDMYAERVLAIADAIVCPFVRQSHPGALSKRCKLDQQIIMVAITQFFIRKFHAVV